MSFARTDVEQLFGINASGYVDLSGLSSSLINWLTYVLILHPIGVSTLWFIVRHALTRAAITSTAAGLAAASVLTGLLAHIRELQLTCLTTTLGSLSATAALLAFVFDMVAFTIARQRINSSDVGGQAEYGNACWLTLAGWACMTVAGCCFGCGRRVVRQRRRDQSEMVKPQLDPEYSAMMRQEALVANMRKDPSSGFAGSGFNGGVVGKHGAGGNHLPAFADRDGEIIPLTALASHRDDEDDVRSATDEDEDRLRRPMATPGTSFAGSSAPSSTTHLASHPVYAGAMPPRKDASGYSPYPTGPERQASPPVRRAGAGAGAGSNLAAAARAARGYQQPSGPVSPSASAPGAGSGIEPFRSMNNPPTPTRTPQPSTSMSSSQPSGGVRFASPAPPVPSSYGGYRGATPAQSSSAAGPSSAGAVYGGARNASQGYAAYDDSGYDDGTVEGIPSYEQGGGVGAYGAQFYGQDRKGAPPVHPQHTRQPSSSALHVQNPDTEPSGSGFLPFPGQSGHGDTGTMNTTSMRTAPPGYTSDFGHSNNEYAYDDNQQQYGYDQEQQQPSSSYQYQHYGGDDQQQTQHYHMPSHSQSQSQSQADRGYYQYDYSQQGGKY